MRPKCRSIAGAVLTAAAAVTLAACGGGSSDDDAGSTGGGKASSAPIAQLNVATEPVTGLDLSRGLSVPNWRVLSLGMEGLTTLDDSGTVVPKLATEVDTPDPTTYVYTLRDDVRFWDGAPLTADDVVWSLKHNMAADSQTAAQYAAVKSISATADGKVQVKLRSPYALWPYVTAMYGQVTEKRFGEAHPRDIGAPGTGIMGTGPFEFDSFNQQTIELSRNDDWWGGRNNVAKVTFKQVTEPSATALSMRTGESDLTFPVDNKPFVNLPAVTLKKVGGSDMEVIAMNTQRAPWSDVHVRRAVWHLVDREGMVKSVLSGFATPAPAIVPENLWTALQSPSETSAFYETLGAPDLDVDAAKAEMKQSATPNGFSDTLVVDSSDAASQQLGQILKQSLAQVGIKLTLKSVTTEQWLAIYYGPRKDIGIFLVPSSSSIPDPNKFLNQWLGSANAVENGFNSADYVNPDADKLLRTEQESSDDSTRISAMQSLLRMAAEDVPYVPLFSRDKTVAVSDRYAFPANPYFFVQPWALTVTPES